MIYKILLYLYNNIKYYWYEHEQNKIKLNSLIFNDILLLLIKDCKSFNELIDLSTISKSSFKTVQYYLTYKPEYVNYYTDSDSILRYITKNQFYVYNKNDIINQINYKYRLIQYQDIQVLSITNINNDFDQLKSMLHELCGCIKLKQINILHEYYQLTSFECNKEFDTEFYKFNKFYLYWDIDQHQPKSYQEEGEYEYELFDQYSFQFLDYHNPKKLKITTADIESESDLQLNNLNNILYHCKELESIDFEYHDTPLEFYKLIIESNEYSIKSLSIRLDIISLNNIISPQQPIKHNNNSINKLKFKTSINDNYQPYNQSPSSLIKYLINNKHNFNNLNKLGLEIFNITQSSSLQPLIKLPNITTIYCNSGSTESLLQHCLDNPNIHTVNIINDITNKLTGNEQIFKQYLKINKTITNIYINNHSDKNKIKIL